MKPLKFAMTWIVFSFFINAFANAELNQKRRVEGHLKTLIEGKKSPVLAVKDYYSTIHLVSAATVEKVIQKPNGDLEAHLQFETLGRIEQDLESSPRTRKEIKEKTTVPVVLSFRITQDRIHWLNRLETPFVRKGSEAKYIIQLK